MMLFPEDAIKYRWPRLSVAYLMHKNRQSSTRGIVKMPIKIGLNCFGRMGRTATSAERQT
jgi:hypothetical protein